MFDVFHFSRITANVSVYDLCGLKSSRFQLVKSDTKYNSFTWLWFRCGIVREDHSARTKRLFKGSDFP